MPEVYVPSEKGYTAVTQDIEQLISVFSMRKDTGYREFFKQYREFLDSSGGASIICKLADIFVDGDPGCANTSEAVRAEQRHVSALGIAAGGLYIARLARFAPEGAEVLTNQDALQSFLPGLGTYQAIGVPVEPASVNAPTRDEVFAEEFRTHAADGLQVAGDYSVQAIENWGRRVTQLQSAQRFFTLGAGLMIDTAQTLSEGRVRAEHFRMRPIRSLVERVDAGAIDWDRAAQAEIFDTPK